MFRNSLSRPTILVIAILAVLASSAALAENIAVLRLQSFDAVLSDARRVVDTIQGEGSADAMMQPLLNMLEVPGADVLDRSAPLMMVLPMEGISLGARGLIVVVPLSDPDNAAAELEKAMGDGEADETGVLYFKNGEGTEVAAKVHGGHLVVGQSRDLVAGFDPASAFIPGAVPPGNLALDIDLAPLAPMIQMGLDTGRQVVQQQMSGEDAESDTDPEMSNGMLDLYFGFINDAVNNTSRIQLSLEVGENHILMHNRWLPQAGSTLEGLLAAQSGGLPELARYIEPGAATATMAGQFILTDAAREALSVYVEGYTGLLSTLIPMMEEQTATNPLSSLIGGMGPLMNKWMDCYQGDFASAFHMGDGEGMRIVQLAGVGDAAICRSAMNETTSVLNQKPEEADQETFLSATSNVWKYKGVLANRQITRMPFPEGAGDEALAAELMQGWFGKDGLVTYYGMTEDHILSVAGPGADAGFKALVDRLTTKAKKKAKMSGITADLFAPVETGPGFFISFDMRSMFKGILAAVPEDGESLGWIQEFLDEVPVDAGRITEGFRLDKDAVHISFAAPIDLLKEIGRLSAKSEELAEAHDHDHEGEHEEP